MSSAVREALESAGSEIGLTEEKEPVVNDVQPEAPEVEEPTDEVEQEPDNKQAQPTKTDLPEQKAETKSQPAETEIPKAPSETVQPPQFWKAEHREIFSKIPVEAQKAILDYENQRNAWANRVANEVASARNVERQFNSIVEPHSQRLKLAGIEPIEAIDKLLRWSDILDDEGTRIAGFQRLLSTYGLTPEHLIQNGQEGFQPDPVNSQLFSKISELQAWKEEQQRQAQEMEARRAEQQLVSEIEAVKGERDSAGNSLFPRFDIYAPHMAGAIQRMRAEHPYASNADLIRAAYREVDSSLGSSFAPPAPVAPAANSQRAQAAQRAAAVNVKSKPSVEIPSRPKNAREALQEAYNELSGA